jgi:hypothetical protein
MSGQSIAFWALATFSATFAFSAKRRLVCLVVFAAGTALAAMYGAGLIAETFLQAQIQMLWDIFNAFGPSSLPVSLGAGSFGGWLGGKYAES